MARSKQAELDAQFIVALDKSDQRDLKKGIAKILHCANCKRPVFHGAMQLISLGIANREPVCSYECNKALGQAK